MLFSVGVGNSDLHPAKCKRSYNGYHKYGGIHFIGKDRREFVRACRFCPAVIGGTVADINSHGMVSLKLISKVVKTGMVDSDMKGGMDAPTTHRKRVQNSGEQA